MRSERGSLHTVVGRRPCLVMTDEVIPIKRRTFRFSPDLGRCASAATVIRRPRTGRTTSKNNATQCEPVISQNGRPEAISGCLRRSTVWGVSIWGTEGRELKSRQPDKETAVQPVFPG